MAWLLMDTTDAISWAPSEANSFWCGLKQCDVTGKERQRGHHTAAGQQQGPSLGCPWLACSPDPPSQAQHPQPCTTPTAFWTSLPEWDLDLAQLLPFKEEKNLRRHIPGRASKGARACDGFTGSAPPIRKVSASTFHLSDVILDPFLPFRLLPFCSFLLRDFTGACCSLRDCFGIVSSTEA